MGKFLICAIVSFLMSFSVQAEVSFTASIKAMAEAQNAAKAKEIAMSEAQRNAFLQVSGRLTSDENVQELNKLTDEQLLHFIREVSVISEKNGSTTYQADLNITINAALLKQYMQENEMLNTKSLATEMLIIPLYESESGKKLLWEDENIWRQAWLDKGLIKSGQINIRVLPSSADNRRLFTLENVSQPDTNTCYQIAATHHVSGVYSVQAVRAGRNTLAVIIRSCSSSQEKRLIIFDDNGSPEEKAIAETVSWISMNQPEKPLAFNADDGKLIVIYEYQKLKDWINIEKKLKSINQIKSITTEAATSGKIKLLLEYSGGYQQLVYELEKNGLNLFADNGMFILK